MNTYKIQTVLTEDGTVLLKELPFYAGDAVEVVIRSQPKTQQDKIITNKSRSNLSPLREREPSRYDEAFESADWEYLQGISYTMSEWESEADECAYNDL